VSRSLLQIGLLAGLLASAPSAAGEPRRHVLQVEADGLAFELSEPPGWFVDSTIAREFGAAVVLYPETGDPRSPGTPVMRVAVARKSGRDAGASVERALAEYRARYRGVELERAAASHPRYRAYAAKFCLAGRFCEYVTLVDPDPAGGFLLSVALTRPKRAATSMELEAYNRVIASLSAN